MIPEGYRLLTSADVGKVFGTDLEQVIYFDTTADMSLLTMGGVTWIGGIIKSVQQHQLTMVFDEVLVWDKRYASVPSPYWIYDTYTIPSGTEITSYFTSGSSWNNTFLYVKEKVEEVDPYNIVIKNKEGIKLLTKDKNIHFDDDVKVTIDESLLGGSSEETGHTVTISQLVGLSSYKYSVADYGGQYSLDGGETWNDFASIPLTLQNVKTIMFQALRSSQYNTIYVSYPYNYNAGKQSICFIQDNGSYELNPIELKITKDTNIYIGCTQAVSGGGAD